MTGSFTFAPAKISSTTTVRLQDNIFALLLETNYNCVWFDKIFAKKM
jgi:hypothetical protein